MKNIDELIQSHIGEESRVDEGMHDFDRDESFQQIFFMLEGLRSNAKVKFPDGQRPRNGSTRIAVELEPNRPASIFTITYVGQDRRR